MVAGQKNNTKESEQKGQRLIAELRKAPQECNTTLCLRLIAAGASLNTRTEYGDTALLLAAAYGHTDLALALLEKGADTDMQNEKGNTALTYAAWYGRTDITHAILAQGADAGLKTKKGQTAWDLAAENGHHDLAQAIRTHHIRKTFTAAAKKGTKQPRKIIRRKMGAAP